MSAENPTDPKEVFNKNVENAHEEALEMNKDIDEAKVAEEKAGREAELAEQARQDTERSEQEAAALLGKMQGGSVENSVEQVEVVPWEETESDVEEMSKMMMDSNDVAKVGEEFNVAHAAFFEKRGKRAAEVARKAGYESFSQLRDAKNQSEDRRKQDVLDSLMSYTALAALYVDRNGNDVNKF
ncbi:hypothetical protein A2609_02025 [Candidatus Kaiserbacteria bacterium RIFOXYD1_FULL_47_14]|uniref:Uncharacterized protein n=1 Tax=Candidatus Kaiserbacteria bacterium RIFOXYD1_FULL_47_14 TaxID=1798533 RepID=A0A1F6G4F4_9BACT|nr:MAG: hypothetical protein A2609_02025 [Candidatus Kaiserbacteria bacterium RIFOXYD1_FULL_47_14]